jgi:menaquinone-dependent protoporphyrinogen oxidase
MRVLVSAASRHGGTEEIAREIAVALGDAGLEPVVLAPDEVRALEGYEAVIVGSAIYMGEWMDSARDFVERFSSELGGLPVWLFSSGPLDPSAVLGDEERRAIAEITAATGARSHRLFAGKVDPAELGLGERVLLEAGHAPVGDFRPWSEIRAWGEEIAAALKG